MDQVGRAGRRVFLHQPRTIDVHRAVADAQAAADELAGQAVDFTRIPAYDYIDLATRIGVAENFDLTVTVANLFDKQPPLVGSTVGSTSFNSGNTYPSTYDALGRRFSVAARLHF